VHLQHLNHTLFQSHALSGITVIYTSEVHTVFMALVLLLLLNV